MQEAKEKEHNFCCVPFMAANGVPFSAEKPRRLQRAIGTLPRAGFRIPLQNKKRRTTFVVLLMAERKGFEPLNAFNTLHDFQSCAFDQLSHLSIALRSITAKIIIAKKETKSREIFKKIQKRWDEGFEPHPTLFLPHVTCGVHRMVHSAVYGTAEILDGFANTGFGAGSFMCGYHHADDSPHNDPRTHTF